MRPAPIDIKKAYWLRMVPAQLGMRCALMGYGLPSVLDATTPSWVPAFGKEPRHQGAGMG